MSSVSSNFLGGFNQEETQADVESSDDEQEIYNPLKLPMGWDGKSIPYWLYKLHGLGQAYIYLDEAHSIGAIGKTGRGVCELLGVDPADIDIMMGTFTKSFGSSGGYIAASKEIIQYIKSTGPAHLYATSMSPPAAQQVISAIKVVLGEDGTNRGAQKLAQIRENSNFFRTELQKMGFEVLGDNDSPVMPVMVYNLGKLPAFSRECHKNNLAVVVVGFPATPLLLARARICISASHTREDLVRALEVISNAGDLVGIKYFPLEPQKLQPGKKIKRVE